MKLKQGFITQNFQGQQLMVAAGPAIKLFHGIVRSNETAAFIIDRLKSETSEEEIVAAMLEEYDADENAVRQDVKRIVEQLRGISAIDE